MVSSLVLHHLAPGDLRQAVGEIRRVLKRGGRVFVIDFQSLDQAGKPLHAGHGGHSHGPDQARQQQLSRLHDHQQTFVALLQAAGLTDARSSLVAFGQRFEVTRGRLPGG